MPAGVCTTPLSTGVCVHEYGGDEECGGESGGKRDLYGVLLCEEWCGAGCEGVELLGFGVGVGGRGWVVALSKVVLLLV